MVPLKLTLLALGMLALIGLAVSFCWCARKTGVPLWGLPLAPA